MMHARDLSNSGPTDIRRRVEESRDKDRELAKAIQYVLP